MNMMLASQVGALLLMLVLGLCGYQTEVSGSGIYARQLQLAEKGTGKKCHLAECKVFYSSGFTDLENKYLQCTHLKTADGASPHIFAEISLDKEWVEKGRSYYAEYVEIDVVCEGSHDQLIYTTEPEICTGDWCVHPVFEDTAKLNRRRRASSDNDLAGCDGAPLLLSGLRGSLISPNYPLSYPADLTCSYIIEALPGYRIIVSTEYMNVSTCAASSVCCDKVQIDGSAPLCGLQTALEPLHFSSGSVAINFTTDHVLEHGAGGFRINYIQEKIHFTDDEGYIQSPNYAGHPYNLYPNNLNLTYTIEVDEDKHIMIEFDDLFHIEGDIGSCIDKLVISGGLEHGLSAHSNELCGRMTSMWRYYHTLTNRVKLRFMTDGSARYEGFRLKYTAVKRVFTEHSGVILSPSYPDTYPENIYTEYHINAPNGYAIKLYANEFDIPACVEDDFGFCAECSNDGSYLEIVSGPGTLTSYIFDHSGEFPSGRFCNGASSRDKLISIDNSLTLRFRSAPGAPAGSGFNISYQFVSNQIHLRRQEMFTVQVAEAGFKTLGYIYYEVIIPKGYTFEILSGMTYTSCQKGEYMIIAHDLEDIHEGNAQLICSTTSSPIQLGDFKYPEPRYHHGSIDWVMRFIVSTDYLRQDVQLVLAADSTVFDKSIGVLHGHLNTMFWSSYRDLQNGMPYVELSAHAPKCQTMEYTIVASPPCDITDAQFVLKSPYLVPYGIDQPVCGINFGPVTRLDGNELTLYWSPPVTYHPSSSDLYYVVYKTVDSEDDCSFDVSLCRWKHWQDSESPVSWSRTFEELQNQYFKMLQVDSHLGNILAAFYDDNKEQALGTDYYIHVRMDRNYAGEEARIMSPLLSADIRRTLSFEYHMHGDYVGHLNVYTWSPATDTWRLVWSRHGPEDILWQTAEGIPVSACSDYHVVFEATIPYGISANGTGDVAVDHIVFCEVLDDDKDCTDTLCGSNGRCIDAVPSSNNHGADYECCCHTGYTGLNCSSGLDLCRSGEHKCLNGGSCDTWQYIDEILHPAVCRCAAGYTGLYCEQEVNECDSHPCMNDARCVDEFNGYHCICPMYYSGTNCEQLYDACLRNNPCTNGGTCHSLDSRAYKCTCPPGFTGATCAQEINECQTRPCMNGGQCIDKVAGYQCDCLPGFDGKRCELNRNGCSDALKAGLCHNGASCMDTKNGFKCQCTEGWQGVDCSEQINDCLSSPCVNNGICVDRLRDYQCLCQPGFSGKRCEVEADKCQGHRCQNGVCSPTSTGYRCDCLPGYNGQFCEVSIVSCQSDPCAEGATCHTLPYGQYWCECPPGRVGEVCDEKVDYCKDCQSCLNGGSCVDLDVGFKCQCAPGYFGHFCEYEASGCQGNPCLNGICSDLGADGFVCKCDEGWSGVRCEVEDHALMCEGRNPCYHGSTCLPLFNSYLCLCADGYNGEHCEHEILECLSSPCINGGECNEGTNSFSCDCPSGYSGFLCEIERDPCSDIHCYNGECLVASDGSAQCKCYYGYTGSQCADVIDNCAAKPCHQSAVCHNLINDFYCECDPTQPLIGSLCDQPVNACASKPCQNGGTCLNDGFGYRCSCPANTWGYDCSVQIKPCDRNPCKHGSCINIDEETYDCSCLPSWTGPHCDIMENQCSHYSCQNGGSCFVNSIGNPICVCSKYFTGLHCEQALDPCKSHMCYNGAQCMVGSEGILQGIPYCMCAAGFGGYSCEIDLATGGVVGGLRAKRETYADTEVNNVLPIQQCHPLGNDTSLSTKWLIGAITAGLYLIVIVSTVVYTSVAIKVEKSEKQSQERNNNSLHYYTPKKSTHNAPVMYHPTPGRRTPRSNSGRLKY